MDRSIAQLDIDRAETALIDQLQSENAYLRDRLSDIIRQAATERERADVLQREALHRLEALTPGADDRQRGTREAVQAPERIVPSEGNSTPSLLERIRRLILS